MQVPTSFVDAVVMEMRNGWSFRDAFAIVFDRTGAFEECNRRAVQSAVASRCGVRSGIKRRNDMMRASVSAEPPKPRKQRPKHNPDQMFFLVGTAYPD